MPCPCPSTSKLFDITNCANFKSEIFSASLCIKKIYTYKNSIYKHFNAYHFCEFLYNKKNKNIFDNHQQ